MTERALKLYEEVMALPIEEREEITDRLNDRLQDPAWIAELTRRAQRAIDDPNSGIPLEEVAARMNARFKRP